jgi:hypothetical protein
VLEPLAPQREGVPGEAHVSVVGILQDLLDPAGVGLGSQHDEVHALDDDLDAHGREAHDAVARWVEDQDQVRRPGGDQAYPLNVPTAIAATVQATASGQRQVRRASRGIATARSSTTSVSSV